MSTDPGPRPSREGDLTAGGHGSLDRAVLGDLDRLRAESLLARQDAVDELTRDIHETRSAPLALSEIAGSLDRLEGRSLPSLSELEGLLAAPETAGLALERDLLAELLKDGGEAQAILKKGLVFLKHRRYAEADEWWALNGRGLDPSTSRLSLMLLVMGALTHHWAGDRARADAARARVAAHPLLRSIRPGPGRG